MQALLASEFVDANAALRDISQRARVITRATGVAIALAHKKSMICRASVGHAPSLGSRLDTTSGFSGECVRTGEALRCDDSETDARVDLESCRRLGIRSILAIPIRVENEIIGLLEVFSPKPSAFADWHLSVLKRLVNSPLLSPALAHTPEFLIELEPANKSFVGKPVEVLTQPKAVNLTATPAQFWSDVFVPYALPWNRFAQSLGLHIVLITALVGFVRLGLHAPHVVQPKFNSSDVLYYSSSEYFGHKRQKLLAPRLNTHRAELPGDPVLSVPREQSRRIEEFVPAPDIRLKRDLRVLPSMAWSSVSPSIPASAIMRKQFIAPTAPVSVVAPPPDLSLVGSRRPVAGPRTTVIEPPPSVESASRQVADITIGALQIVSPPPEISYGEPNSKALAIRATLHDDLAAVIAPSPSLDAIHLPSAQARGRLAAGAAQVVPPPPQVLGTGKWRKQATWHDELASVVGPAPSLEGVKGTGAQARGRLAAGAAQVVPPPPQVSATGKWQREATWHDDLASVVGPAPSLEGVKGTGAQPRGRLAAGASQVVPPPPQVSGTGNSRSWSQPGAEIAIVPPPPSVTDLGGNTGGDVSTRRAARPNIVPLAPTTERASSDGEPNTAKWKALPPMEDISDDNSRTDRKELNDVAPIAPAAALASSSYFASSEIFIAEERLGVHRRRYIKLVYDYLPYQKRLSEYGPNYPEVAKLRATRDVTCDENLSAGAYSISQAEVLRSNGSQSQDVALDQDRLPCFRTTADDYRRALAHHPKSHSTH